MIRIKKTLRNQNRKKYKSSIKKGGMLQGLSYLSNRLRSPLKKTLYIYDNSILGQVLQKVKELRSATGNHHHLYGFSTNLNEYAKRIGKIIYDLDDSKDYHSEFCDKKIVEIGQEMLGLLNKSIEAKNLDSISEEKFLSLETKLFNIVLKYEEHYRDHQSRLQRGSELLTSQDERRISRLR